MFFCPLGFQMDPAMMLAANTHENINIIKPTTATKGKTMMNVNARASAPNHFASGMRGNMLAFKAAVDGEFMLFLFGDASKGCAAYHVVSCNLARQRIGQHHLGRA